MASVELLFGPLLIGTFLNTILYGVLIVQAFIYYQTYKRDATWIRYLILYLFICETINTGCDMGMMYEPLVKRYATPHALTFLPIMLAASPITTAFISTPVQLFIGWRIKTLSGSWLLPSAIAFFAFCALVGGIATTTSAIFLNRFTQIHQFDGAVITWLASSAAADIVITASLVWSLHKRKTGYSATDTMVNKLIRFSLQTGAVTALAATVDVVLFLASKTTTLNFVSDFALSKLYTNSLLSTLNARAGWNNLIGEQHADNVLFGDVKSITSSHRRTGVEANTYSAAALELQVRGNPRYQTHTNTSRDDSGIELGISVTKMVERFDD